MLKECCGSTVFATRSLFILLIAVTIAGLGGCSTPQVKPEPVFFPPPPNPPRIQFLKSISSSKDVEKEKSNWISGLSQTDQVKPIVKPYGITYDKNKLYVCDVQAGTVVIIDLKKETFDYLKGNINYGKLKKPVNVAVDDAGNMFVADTARKEVLMYDASGTFIKTFGREIAKKPVDVAVHDTNLYILDLGDNDIKVIDRQSGELVRSIGKSEEGGKSLSMPTNFTIGRNGLIYITNVGTGNVIKLDVDGHFLSSFGKLGDAFGEFTRPKGIAVDDQNRMYVVDGGNQNVQIFAENQRLMMFFGTPPLKIGALNLPTTVAVTTDNLDYFQKLAEPGFVLEQVIFVANQMGNAKISIYGLGHKEGAEPGAKSQAK